MNRILIFISLTLIFNSSIFCQKFYFEDDFESYNINQQLVVQNPVDWTTWSNSPGSEEDPYIINFEGNVVEFAGADDLVYVINNFTNGFYTISFELYIPDGNDAYFNTLQEYSGNSSSWGMQVFFGYNNPGVGSIDAGGANAANFNFTYDTWLSVKVTIDLDEDWGEFFLDDELIHGWVWSSGTYGTNSLNQLGGSNFYAWTGGVYGNPVYHFDNYCLDEYLLFEPGPPPDNLTGPAEVINGEPISLIWNGPDPVIYGDWIYWDQQVNSGLGFGLPEGGTFYAASHWNPSDLQPYDGKYITKMNWHHFDNAYTATFVLKIWTGPDANNLVLNQPVESNFGWNEVELENAILIDASQELWFGYEVNCSEGETPAGIDFGPAVSNNGDMISTDGVSWVTLNSLYGIDRNWNLAAYVFSSPSVPDNVKLMKIAADFDLIGNSIDQSKNFKVGTRCFSPKEKEYIDSYNVYRDDALIGNTTDTTFSDNNYPGSGQYTYHVTAIYYPGGESEPSLPHTVSVVTGINENSTTTFRIYPNPATDFVNISSNYNIKTLNVYNFAGQAISEETVDGKSYRMNTSSFIPGVYLFRITTDEGVVSKRVVIE